VVELAGLPASVAGDAAWLRASADARDAGEGALDGIRALQGSVPDGGLRFRLAVLPSHLDAALVAVRAAGATALAYPGLGLLYAFFPRAANGETPPGQRAFRAVAAAARDARGGFECEAAPLAVKRACEMFGEPSPALGLFRALKERFDPDGVLNPGCFAGGL
jgi:glycolate oxidase FAD binding subunit